MAEISEVSQELAIVKAFDLALQVLKTKVHGVTTTNVSGKDSLDVNVTDISINATNDSIETRSLAMKTALDEASTTVTYVGEAATGTAANAALWRIKRLTQSGTVLMIEWADGNGNFDNIWDSRATLSYS